MATVGSSVEELYNIPQDELDSMDPAIRTQVMKMIDQLKKEDATRKTLADQLAAQQKLHNESLKNITLAVVELQKARNKGGPEKTVSDIRNQLADGTFRGTLRDPTFDELVTWTNEQTKAAQVGTESMRQYANKAIAKMPHFSGDENKLSWEAFMTHIKLITTNMGYSSAEIKQIIVGSLNGAAFQYINANPELLEKPYRVLLDALQKEFQRSLVQALALLRGAKQGSKEPVREYVSRIKIYAKALMPAVPPPMRVFSTDSKDVFVPNPVKDMEGYVFSAQISMVGGIQLDAFLKGLRADILGRMPAKRYTEFEEAIKAAQDAEFFVLATSPQHVNALLMGENPEEVHALMGGTERRPEKDTCHKCGRLGHWARDCRVKTSSRNDPKGKGKKVQYKKRYDSNHSSRSQSRNQSGQNSRLSSRSGSRSPVSRLASEFRGLDVNQINAIVGKLKKIQKKSGKKQVNSLSKNE